MKNLFYTLIAAILLISCGNSTEKKTETASTDVKQADRIEVLYFHGAQRCVTCKAIEVNTKALLDSLYSNEIA
jgi:hypothetical protein